MRIGIDTGGTYTDAVLYNDARRDEASGVAAAAKALTTRHDLSIGVAAALDAVLPAAAGPIELVSLSTTLATNALVEGQGSPVCLLLVGQREEALARAGLRAALGGDPVAFVPGGHDAAGEEREPIDLETARQAILAHATRVEAFAVAGLFAVRNAAHERAVAALAGELTGLPVTCSHELTTRLDAPRRALTAVLNARLIPLLAGLIRAVDAMLRERALAAPLMVVMGDGSLTSAEAALARPVETILSGPAASVMGARALAGAGDAWVIDMGGTTTDIARLRDGWPALDSTGATVGGWHTMVEAVDVRTVGIGGDSEVRRGEEGAIRVGPRRVVPLARLAVERPETLETLRAQLARGAPREHDGRFALRERPLGAAGLSALTSGERWLWDALAEGPVALERLLERNPLERQLERLLRRGHVAVAALTPTDAAHVLGHHAPWSVEAARLGARLFARRGDLADWVSADDPETFSRLVVERVIEQSGRALVTAALPEPERGALEGGEASGAWLVDAALARERPGAAPLTVRIALGSPIVAVGAPAACYYPELAERLASRLEVPAHAQVCNAVGAAASGVLEMVRVLVSAPEEGRFRAHLPEGPVDFATLEEAAARATGAAREEAMRRARAAGALEPSVEIRREDRTVPLFGGQSLFLESEITAIALGRPRTSRDTA